MPLEKSKSPEAFKTNVGTLMREIGKSSHVQSRAQALAVAYSIKRRARAEGGQVHVGPINSTVPGRTDDHPMDVPSGSYVLPSETVSNLGENNTNAGMVKIHQVLSGTPEQIRKFFGAKGIYRANGGQTDTPKETNPVPIRSAGGEYVIEPHIVSIIGGGDIKKGHATLDAWVLSRRKNHIKTLKGLAPPAKD
jgi:hypothetical protein